MPAINWNHRFLPFLMAGVFLLASLFVHPLMPVDETRYVSVAWEMWIRGDFWVPYLNGETYSHKPPLMFWLMHAGWYCFGVNDWTPRLIGPFFSLLNLLLVGRLADKLWPAERHIAQLSRYLLFGFYFWAISSTLTMFDVMLSFFVLFGIYLLYSLATDRLSGRRLVNLSIAVGLGILAKGPVVLLHLIFILLSAPLWHNDLAPKTGLLRWYSYTLGATLFGIAIALCWAIPAARIGGQAYGQAILWGQTGGRMVDSFAHRLPIWWYFKSLPLLLLPWLIWRPFWESGRVLRKLDQGTRFCLFWLLPVFIAFCLISGKRLHYLLPLFPVFALLLSRIAVTELPDSRRLWNSHRPFTVLVAIIAASGLIYQGLNDNYHWQPMLTGLSPVWLAVLLVISVALWWLPGKSIVQSVGMVNLLTVVSSTLFAAAFFQIFWDRYDVSDTAQQVAKKQKQGKKLFYLGKYHGEFNFIGRLRQPIQSIEDITEWEDAYPGAYLISVYKGELPKIMGTLVYQHPYRGRWIAIFRH